MLIRGPRGSETAEIATGAFVLAWIGAIFHAIGGIVISAGALVLGLGLLFIALTVIFIVLAFLGAFWMYSGDKRWTTYGGILTLIIAIFAFPTFWGLFIGSILGFVGGILAFVWNPSATMPASAP